MQYTSNAIDDIQLAIQEKKVECPYNVPLDEYGNKIRSIKTEQKPTFCPWYDLGTVYYSFKKKNISFKNSFKKLDKTDVNIVENIYNN